MRHENLVRLLEFLGYRQDIKRNALACSISLQPQEFHSRKVNRITGTSQFLGLPSTDNFHSEEFMRDAQRDIDTIAHVREEFLKNKSELISYREDHNLIDEAPIFSEDTNFDSTDHVLIADFTPHKSSFIRICSRNWLSQSLCQKGSLQPTPNTSITPYLSCILALNTIHLSKIQARLKSE